MDRAEEKSLEVYPIESYEMHDDMYRERNAYVKGYCQAKEDYINNLWHDPDEIPDIEREIIWESEHFHGKFLGGEWKPKIDVFGRKERWCYLADILPFNELGVDINRPFSKVDYYLGYEQAEKDLELTLKDIKRIIEIHEDVCDMDSCNDIYEEVLERFLENK